MTIFRCLSLRYFPTVGWDGLMLYGRPGAMTVRRRKNFQFNSDNKTNGGEVMCETRLLFLSQKAQLLKMIFLF